MTLDFQHQRVMDDLLGAERAMREKNEEVIRDMQQGFVKLANKFDGERFESLRRDNPMIPGSWTVADWMRFFEDVTLTTRGWNTPELRDRREIQELQQQVEAYKAKVKDLEKRLEEERTKEPAAASPNQARAIPEKKSKAAPRPIAVQPQEDEITPPTSDMVKDVSSILSSLPSKVPAPYEKILDGGNRTGVILDQALQRYWIMIYLIGRWRISTWIEMDVVVSQVVGLKPGAGSMHRLLENLVEKNLVYSETIRGPYTSLSLYRLSPEGEKMYETLFHAKPVENEWARINRLHQGEQEVQHTMNIIAFTAHARARGYSTRTLPENKETSTPPDLWISRDGESLYVEVELSEKENPIKWKNQAKLNNGKVAIAAGTLQQRETLVNDCKAMHLTGYAVEMEIMVKAKRFGNITPDDPLWTEIW